ncbi:5-formyltetrahydrofolate cyclo-ligase [Chondromyces apiculatus]|uniref:5-formyltetrahydrofolate cyclo-ligase n=1 Tax=Chondromyces apiculatus DSM 436 TaxID=1192034 RepID=A0A017T107_9BACT|nr:5-formyltetrahydrofolate cyclo-ligase [Chondromyces apiculatus]EYF02908.1 5-formyltetrahydrofolate cyclo-ligase [Chondromyces apiculatus DSM 436]
METDDQIETVLRVRAKKELRKRARGLRSAVPRDAILSRSSRILDALCALPEIMEAASVAMFYPIEGRNEVHLVDLDPRLRERGIRVAYPSIDPDAGTMTFRFVDTPDALEERGYGFREPDPAAEEALTLGAVVVPCLQIDPRGYRIGYGAGYYDRTLPRFCPPAHAIAVAFDFQLVSEVPETPHDVPVHLVVTDTRQIRVTPP